MPQAGTDSEPLGDDPDVLRRRIRELELENALMREVVEVVKKDCICLMVCVPVYRGFVGRVTGEKSAM